MLAPCCPSSSLAGAWLGTLSPPPAEVAGVPALPATLGAQIDILSSPAEVAEVVSFVRSNASRVLGVDDPQVLPVR